MKLYSIGQPSFGEVDGTYDVVIAASGYEARARYVAVALKSHLGGAGKKVVLAFAEHENECSRPENDKAFKECGFKAVRCRGGAAEDVTREVYVRLAELDVGGSVRVLVDISSMTRTWYGAIVRLLNQLGHVREAVVDFVYTPTGYVEPTNEYPPNRVVAPVPGFIGNTLPDKPTALGIGLGYDRDRALGLKDYLDPQLTLVFSANPSTDARFVHQVEKVNRQLLDELQDDKKFVYPVRDCVATFRLLESVCNGIRHDWRVVICALGPKIFGLCCFLVASVHSDISVWRVSADEDEAAVDHQPEGVPIVLRTNWRI